VSADLHIFKDDLAKIAPKGSNAPPRSISARALDGNFRRVTLLPSEDIPPTYSVEYKEDGTIIKDIRTVPDGNRNGNLLVWNGDEWVPTLEPNAPGTIIFWDGNGWELLGPPEDSTIKLKQFDVCQNGQPKQYTMLVWESED
jgi:hypothetical protein